MASSGVQPPERLNFNKPEEWPRWIKRFDRYLSVSQIDDDERRVNALVYAMGSRAEDVMLTFGLSADDAKKYSVVRERFQKHFVVRRNVIYERACFHQRAQGDGESIETFLTDLYAMIDNCEYGALRDEILRDRIVIGICDKGLSQKLQLNDKLTLESALVQVRSKEMINKQSHALQQLNIARADAVKRTPNQADNTARNPKKRTHRKKERKECCRCGTSPSHKISECPARDAKCNSCGKKGHWAKCCFKKGDVTHVGDACSSDDDFLGSVSVDTVCSDEWDIQLSVNGTPVVFKIDCGADVTLVSEAVYKRIDSTCKSELLPTAKRFMAADDKPMNVTGVFTAELINNDRDKTVQQVYVVKNLKKQLLGKPAIKALNILQRTNAVQINPAELPDEREYKQSIKSRFPQLFRGLGTIKNAEYNIKLQSTARPFAINAPRRISQPLLPKVKAELDRMLKNGAIRRLDTNEASEWCAPIVVVPKSNGSVRICTDFTQLNKYVIRPRSSIKTVDETLSKVNGAVFSKLDANSGFFQIKLAKESQLLTSFVTPFGRYCYTRVPFGITSGPDVYEDIIDERTQDLPNMTSLVDDICVMSPDVATHEEKLFPVLQRLQDIGATLNIDKCEFFKKSITFVGHKVSGEGIQADEKKVKAIKEMPAPTNTTELRRFLGMVNQLGKFSNKIADCTNAMNCLLKKDAVWTWGPAQKKAFRRTKDEMCSSSVLASYSPKAETKIRSDASNHGYGAVLLQRHAPDQDFRPVYYASKSLTPAESRYSVIEKEAGAITWACEKFDKYILGMTDLKIETDQKPLVTLLGKKSLDDLPPRIVRFRMKLMRYTFTISHVPGKYMYASDCLSRASVADTQGSVLSEEAESYVGAVLSNLPCSDRRLEELKDAQHNDAVCLKLAAYAREGWPDKGEISSALMPYYQFRDYFSVYNGLLLKSERIVVPASMHIEILDKIHAGHLGINKCRRRAIASVWWPGLSKQIEQMVNNCRTCAREKPDQAEPLQPTPLPERPWQRVAADLCEHNGNSYLVVTDYYSRYFEVAKLENTKASTVIVHLKSMMARHGAWETLVSDNGPQFANDKMSRLSVEWGFTHLTSSPRYARSNGAAESAVKRLKSILKKNDDPYIALLNYRATPLQNGYSPAELLMGRRLRTTLPAAPHTLLQRSHPDISQKESEYRHKMKLDYDSRHRARELPALEPGDSVLIKDTKQEGVVVQPAENAPRSHVIATPTGKVRRNRRHLNKLPADTTQTSTTPSSSDSVAPTPPSIEVTPHSPMRAEQQPGAVRTRSGRISKQPDRLNTPELEPVCK